VDGGNAGPVFAPPGQHISFPHIVTNTGNGIDTMLLSLTASGVFIPQQIALYDDPNGNGIVDPGEIVITDLKEMVMGQSRAVVISAEIPSTALPAEIASITMTVSSTFDSSKSDIRTDTMEVGDKVSFALDLSTFPIGQVAGDGTIQYTLKTINTGVSSAEPIDTPVFVGSVNGQGGVFTTIHGVLLSLGIPANTIFETATVSAPEQKILLYKIGGVLFDSEPLATNKDEVKEVGMVVLSNGGALVPDQVTLMKLKVSVLSQISKTAIPLIGSISYNDNNPATGVITTNSNMATVYNSVPAKVIFTDPSGAETFFYRPGQKIFIKVVASSLNKNASVAETIGNIALYAPTSGDQESVNIIESGANTGIFLAEIDFTKQPDPAPATFNKSGGGSGLVWQVDSKDTQGNEAGAIKNKAAKTTAIPNDGKLEIISNSHLQISFVNPVDQSEMKADVLIDPSGVAFNSTTNQVIPGLTVMLVDAVSGAPVVGFGKNPVVTGVDGRFSFDAPTGQYKVFITNKPPTFSSPSVLPPANLRPLGRIIDPLGSYGQAFKVESAMGFDIPLDPTLPILFVEKTANKRDAEIGDQVLYTVKITNTSGTLPVREINLLDQPPIGITYIPGSATCTKPNAKIAEPLADPSPGRPVTFTTSCTTPIANNLSMGESVTITYKAIVGPSAIMGDGVNRANALGKSILGVAVSNESSVAVKIVQGVFTDRAILIGKVFIDLNGDGEQNDGEPGVPGIRLVLTDGTQVTTDEGGKYSLYGLKPDTDVLKVDPMSLPFEFHLSDSSTRFAGDPYSRFIDLIAGELHKANFTIASLPREVWEPIIKQRKNVGAPLVGAQNVTPPDLEHPQGVPLQISDDGDEEDRDEGDSDEEDRDEGDNIIQTDQNQLPKRDRPSLQGEHENVGSASTPAIPMEIDLKTLVSAASSDLTIVFPKHGALIPIRSTSLIVTGHSGIDFKLSVNGKPIADSHVGSVVVSNEKSVSAILWVAIPLETGENKVEVAGYDAFGNIRQTQTITLSVPGKMEVLKLSAFPKELPADAVSKSTITLALFDHDGLPVLMREFLTIKTTSGKLQGEDKDPEMPGHQIVVSEGIASLELIASDKVEDAIVTATIGSAGKIIGEVKVSFLPALRDMMAVGILDGKINLRNFKGNIMPVEASDSFKETLTADSRAAFYLKGKILGKALLTVAYNSDKDEKDRLFQDIKPTEFYPIYGDASEKKFDAQSAGKLYVKVEQGKSYLLFGDFSPDFTDNELQSYQRSFNGLKYHYENEDKSVTAFHNRSFQKQVVERILGNGTSGFYQLTQFPIVENSDFIEIITVDRERPGIIIRTETMGRFVDYTLSTLTGRILFKSPVGSFDKDFNPIFIKATYETTGAGIAFDTYGINGKLKLSKKLQAGGTFVQSTEPNNRFTLYGADLRARLAEGVVASFEVANSNSILKGASAGGEGYKVSLSIKPNNAINATAYWLKTDPEFINPSANVGGGKIEQGVLAHFMVREGTILGAEAISSKDKILGTNRLTTDFKIEQGFGNARGEIGLKHIEDQTPTQDMTTETLRAKISSPFPGIPRLTTSIEYEEALNSSANIVTLGNDMRLTQTTKLYSKQQWISSGTSPTGADTGRGGISEEGRRILTTVGIDSNAIAGTTAFSEYRIAQSISGREDQAAIGLRNRYAIKQGVSLSSTLEQTKTLEGPANNDATAFSIGLEHLANPNLKGTARVEIRKTQDLVSQLGGLAVAYKLRPNLSLLARETIFNEDGKKGQADKLTSHLIVGAAFRPVSTDAVHLLAKSEFKYDATGVGIARIYIQSLESNIAFAPKTILFLKYANRKVQDADAFNSMTQMVEGRVTYDLTAKIDLGLTGRHFWQDHSKSKLWGYGVEGGYRLDRNLWLSLGYQVNGFDDNSITNDEAFVHGMFIRLRYKFDEGVMAFLKGGPMTLKGERPLREEKPVFLPVLASPPPALVPPAPVLLPLPTATAMYKLVDEEKTPVLVPVQMPEASISYSPVSAVPRLEETFLLTHTQFKFNSSKLTQSGKRQVSEYAEFLQRNPAMIFIIEGHTDQIGKAAYNYRLGLKRAKEVWKMLKLAGVKNQMGITSYGKTRPIDKAKKPAAYAKNRRVEVKIEEWTPQEANR
jgi:uncharacterized repeat protein (TIGR01451 family)